MNYAGFTKPMWTWLCDPHDPPEFLGQPVVVPHLPGEAVAETMREFTSHLAWQSLTHSFNLVGSHDTTRIRTLVDHDPRLMDVAAGLLFTMPSMPMMTYGDEIGMLGAFGEDGRRPMPWDESLWDQTILTCYSAWSALRRESVALRRGGLRWAYAAEHMLVFLRESVEETALVYVARGAHRPVTIDTRGLPGIATGSAAYGPALDIGRGTVTFTAGAPRVTVHIWRPTKARTRNGGPARR
jgi:alpha-glucosidase